MSWDCLTFNLDTDVSRGACADSSACEDAECKRPQTARHIVRQVYRLRLQKVMILKNFMEH